MEIAKKSGFSVCHDSHDKYHQNTQIPTSSFCHNSMTNVFWVKYLFPLQSTWNALSNKKKVNWAQETLEKYGKDIALRAKKRCRKEIREKAYDDKFQEQELTYHCSAYLPQYTEVSKPSQEHFKQHLGNACYRKPC